MAGQDKCAEKDEAKKAACTQTEMAQLSADCTACSAAIRGSSQHSDERLGWLWQHITYQCFTNEQLKSMANKFCCDDAASADLTKAGVSDDCFGAVLGYTATCGTSTCGANPCDEYWTGELKTGADVTVKCKVRWCRGACVEVCVCVCVCVCVAGRGRRGRALSLQAQLAHGSNRPILSCGCVIRPPAVVGLPSVGDFRAPAAPQAFVLSADGIGACAKKAAADDAKSGESAATGLKPAITIAALAVVATMAFAM